jgi:hypothetical protein
MPWRVWLCLLDMSGAITGMPVHDSVKTLSGDALSVRLLEGERLP